MWVKKKETDILLNDTKMIQARGQNNLSRALKWGIVHLCTSNRIGDMIKNKKCNFLDFRIFCNFSQLTYLGIEGVQKKSAQTFYFIPQNDWS